MIVPEKWLRPLTISVLLIFLVCFVLRPEASYAAALRGLSLWWQVIAPALLPFFIFSELLLELGLATYMGPLLSRLMRPLFALPGSAALGVALGFCSGFPTGGAIAASLRQKNAISREQGERLVAFTNNAGPLYVTVSVATGLLHCPKAALILAIAHYGANLFLGMIMGLVSRWRGQNQTMQVTLPPSAAVETSSFGKALRQSAERAANNILLVGCYMVFFSTVASFWEELFTTMPPLVHSLLLGSLEMSLGVNALAGSGLPLTEILPWCAALLSFGGLSVISQVMAMIADTDIRPRLYLLCRFLQAGLSFLFTKIFLAVITLPASPISRPEGQFSFVCFNWAICALVLLPGVLEFLHTKGLPFGKTKNSRPNG